MSVLEYLSYRKVDCLSQAAFSLLIFFFAFLNTSHVNFPKWFIKDFNFLYATRIDGFDLVHAMKDVLMLVEVAFGFPYINYLLGLQYINILLYYTIHLQRNCII